MTRHSTAIAAAPGAAYDLAELHAVRPAAARCSTATTAVEEGTLRISLVVLAAAVSMRVLLWVATGLSPLDTEIYRVAKSLASTGTFADPFGVPTGPTAHVAPLYPALLAVAYRLFEALGAPRGGDVASLAVNSCLSAAAHASLPLLARQFGLPLRVGLMAGLLGALVPISFYNELRGGEAPLAALILIWSAAITVKGWREADWRVSRALALGVLWGIAALVSPVMLLVAAGLQLASFATVRANPRRRLTFVGVLGVTVAATIAPWMVRNFVTLGAPVLVRDNLGLELQVSNNDWAKVRLADNLEGGAFQIFHPFTNRREAYRLAALGEPSYNDAKLLEARSWIEHHPGRFAELTAARFVYFWFPVTRRPPQAAVYIILTFAAFLGLWLIRKSAPHTAIAIGAIWAFFPMIYYVVQADGRYRYPVLWTFLLLAAVALNALSSLTPQRFRSKFVRLERAR